MSRLPLVVRRLLMLLLGVCVTECSSQLFIALGVGADPFMILVQGISRQSGLSYGQLSTLIMLICLVAIFLCAREHIHVGTIFCMFCLGPIVDFYAFLFGRILPVQRSLALIVLLIILGCLIVSIGGRYLGALGCRRVCKRPRPGHPAPKSTWLAAALGTYAVRRIVHRRRLCTGRHTGHRHGHRPDPVRSRPAIFPAGRGRHCKPSAPACTRCLTNFPHFAHKKHVQITLRACFFIKRSYNFHKIFCFQLFPRHFFLTRSKMGV